jgi:hypothetical protein
MQGWMSIGQHRPQLGQVRIGHGFRDGQRHVRAMAAVRPGRQARQAVGGEDIPDLPHCGVGLVVEEHLDRMSHWATLSRGDHGDAR